ncbi:MAG: M42 family metallopeptidase [Clostridia bacterium]|nr:M42 family metallopeptidase [Clostridia bacterium]
MDLLKKLTEVFGPSGREKNISEFIKSEVSAYADEVSTDALGNLIVRKKGTKSKIMLAAHMDEIGIVATFTDENGFIRFSAVGGLYNKDLLGRRVRFENGIVGVIGSEEDNKDRKIPKMYVDIGAKDKESAEKLVSTGDMAVFCGEFYENSDTVISKALDNRAGCYVLIEALKNVKSDNDLYFVFTSQEEVGLRGARTSAFKIAPDYALAVDVTDTGDTPEGIKMAVKSGKGAAIKVMDRSVLCDTFVRSVLVELAKKNNIDYQLEVMNDGGTDAGAISLSGSGVKTGGISIPTRYIHSPSELISKKDLNDCTDLLISFAEFDFGGNRID